MQYSKGENAENDKKGVNGLISMNNEEDKFQQNVQGIFDEDVDKSSDHYGYHDEKTNIDSKKKIFLSSQCTYSQDSLATTDMRDDLCMKCNKGGRLLSCSSDSCPLVIHESCLGSDASFYTRGKFYCPFCSYSLSISKYMEAKKKASLARKDLATFICLGPPQESKEHSQSSFGIEGNHLKQNEGFPKNNDLNQNVVHEVNNYQPRKKLEYEHAEPSELHSAYPHFGREAVDATKRLAQSLNEEKQGGKSMRGVSQPPSVHGQQQITAPAAGNSQDQTTSSYCSETSGSEKLADVRSKKGAPYPPEMDLPCEHKCPQSPESSDAEGLSEEDNEDSSVSKYFIRVRKPERANLRAAIPQVRRKRLPWTSEEDDKLKEGMSLLCSPHDKIIPWKKILEHGEGVFEPSRSTMDLKDKWRNMCKASPKSKKMFSAYKLPKT